MLIYHLTVYQDVQAKVQEEIDELFDSKDDGEEITADDITKMTYLDQVTIEMKCFEISSCLVCL